MDKEIVKIDMKEKPKLVNEGPIKVISNIVKLGYGHFLMCVC